MALLRDEEIVALMKAEFPLLKGLPDAVAVATANKPFENPSMKGIASRPNNPRYRAIRSDVFPVPFMAPMSTTRFFPFGSRSFTRPRQAH